MKAKVKSFDILQNRPKVLIVGNGVMRAENNKSWSEMINDISSVDSREVTLPDNVPYSIIATVKSDYKDSDRNKKYSKSLSLPEYKYEKNQKLENLMKIPFDAVLTTNYTYELEYVFDKKYPEYSRQKKYKYVFGTDKSRDQKYIIHDYNHIDNKDFPSQDIWHIHGEQRKISSVVLTHDEYIKLIFKEVEYLKELKNVYQNKAENLEFRSWIDYMILGDLYIIGQGMDFSEFDLWWLINRRLRENANMAQMPKIIFYNPRITNKEGKVSQVDSAVVLDAIGAEIVNCDIDIPCKEEGDKAENSKQEINKAYEEFYAWAIEDIRRRIVQG